MSIAFSKNATCKMTPSHMLGVSIIPDAFRSSAENIWQDAVPPPYPTPKGGRSQKPKPLLSLHRDQWAMEVAQGCDQLVFSKELQRQLFLHFLPLPQRV